MTPAMVAGGAVQSLLGWGSIAALALVGLLVRRGSRGERAAHRTPGTTKTSASD